MANLQKLIDLDGLSYFLGQIKAKFVRSVNNVKPDSNGNINIADMTGATYNNSGRAGLVPIPAAGKQDMALCGDATFKVLPIAGGGTGADNANTALSNLGILGAIVNASVNGKTITFTKKDNTKFSIDTQDTNNGIVAALLEQNGYVKFANGLILQWGFVNVNGVNIKTDFAFPITFNIVLGIYTGQNRTDGTTHDANPYIISYDTSLLKLQGQRDKIFILLLGI